VDTNWKHQKDAITTDQKNRTDDEHIHELDKTKLNTTKKEARIPREEPNSKSGAEDSGERVGRGRKGE
jgi:hypothetical protein